jgi:hypothetical protein
VHAAAFGEVVEPDALHRFDKQPSDQAHQEDADEQQC